MHHRHLSAFVAALVAAGLVTGVSTSSEAAKVKPRNTPTEAQIARLFPGVKNGYVDTREVTSLGVWRKKCGNSSGLALRSGHGIESGSLAGRQVIITTDVGQFSTVADARRVIRSHKRFATTCTRFTQGGDVRAVRRIKLPKVGKQRVGYRMTARDGDEKTFFAVAVVRRGKRVAFCVVATEERVPVKPVRKLARVSARRMK